MRWVAMVVIVQVARAAPPKVRGDELYYAASQAKAELDACAKLAGAAVGDVVADGSWTASGSKSLGANAPAIATCVRAALKAHYQPLPVMTGSASGSMGIGLPFIFPIGTPTQVLPPPQTLLPVWRAALATNATPGDRDALAKLLPADYAVDGRCIKTDRTYASNLEDTWFAGLQPITTWRADEVDAMGAHRHPYARHAAWDGTGLVTLSQDGICAEPFDLVAARAAIDRAGACWVGSPLEVLFDPRVELPIASYIEVATRSGRVCALTKQGAMTCCGRNAVPFAKAPTVPMKQIALADQYACGLDDAGLATCWGDLQKAPKRPFSKLVGGRNGVCGLHADGEIECMERTSPRGPFVDLAITDGVCGLRPDASIECWGRDGRSPPGRWSHLAMGFPDLLCGLRHDQTVGCTHLGNELPMLTPVPQAWTQIAVVQNLGACGIQRDGTLACSDLQEGVIAPRGTPPPAGTFTRITADEDQFCAIRTTGGIACWGVPWPHRTAVPPPQPASFHGAIVDERGAPIANAKIELDRKETVTTAADGTWHAALQDRITWVTVTAPGREIATRYGDRAALAAPIALRPAATVTIDATCAGKPCWSMVELNSSGYLVDSKLEHIAPGSYRIRAWRDHGESSEQLAIVDFTMPFAAAPMTLHPALVATGSGHTLRGTVTARSKDLLFGTRVQARCANGALREVPLDDRGRFELVNVPALPCELVVESSQTSREYVDLKSYADQHIVLRGL